MLTRLAAALVAACVLIGAARANDTDILTAKAQPAVNAYRSCLLDRSATLARVSTEPAEVVAMAAVEACRGPRATAVATFNREMRALVCPPGGCSRSSSVDDGGAIMDVIDKYFAKTVILKIIETRASQRPPAPSAPTSTKPADTPL
jgi:hypothetical protein